MDIKKEIDTLLFNMETIRDDLDYLTLWRITEVEWEDTLSFMEECESIVNKINLLINRLDTTEANIILNDMNAIYEDCKDAYRTISNRYEEYLDIEENSELFYESFKDIESY